ncbi:hypothetical protein Poli38472_010354 [Pythium oligandrum]|uniref:Cyclic nucleotide-binding domain-containing protein n=1 Tax=Pythium oligandrum TaxID=41045 RepID=A0A8K1FDD9_PYTOL|nr:hypothetical protein Poli38472_010354 [Pythium oligandrum]|eukprot:TMW55472.1 hypothetical protein Poli38472_010354 [Pythium oligandrum]
MSEKAYEAKSLDAKDHDGLSRLVRAESKDLDDPDDRPDSKHWTSPDTTKRDHVEDGETTDEDSELEGDESDESGDEAIDSREMAAHMLALSARGHRRSVVSSFVTVDKSWTPPTYAKNEQDAASIRRSVCRNLLFANIAEETLQTLVNAMKYVAVNKGDVIIQQGDTGDLFYILESGVCEVVLQQNRVFGEIEATSDRNFFGELALLYDAPRAATIRAKTDVECWSLDRDTFKRVLMSTTIKQRRLYLEFIDQVPIFSTLSAYEKMIVADALRVQYFEPQSVILHEGTAGDDFYIVEDGEVKCTKDDDEVSARLGSGDFFGELALVTDDTRMATVTAVRKTKCLVLDRKTFKRLLGPMQEHLRKRADLYELYMTSNPRHAN